MQIFTKTGHGNINLTWNRRHLALQRTHFQQRVKYENRKTHVSRHRGDSCEQDSVDRWEVGLHSERVSEGSSGHVVSETWKSGSRQVVCESFREEGDFYHLLNPFFFFPANIFEDLLCIRHYSRCWKYNNELNRQRLKSISLCFHLYLHLSLSLATHRHACRNTHRCS